MPFWGGLVVSVCCAYPLPGGKAVDEGVQVPPPKKDGKVPLGPKTKHVWHRWQQHLRRGAERKTQRWLQVLVRRPKRPGSSALTMLHSRPMSCWMAACRKLFWSQDQMAKPLPLSLGCPCPLICPTSCFPSAGQALTWSNLRVP